METSEQMMDDRYEFLPQEEVSAPPPKSFLQRSGEEAKEAIRPIARTGANLVGLATGLPGDIASLINRFVAQPATEAITGEKGTPYEETFLGKVFPTSEQTTESLRSLSSEYLKPQNKVEEFIDDIVNETALLLSPAKSKVPFAKTVSTASKYLKPLFVSIGANLVGEAVKDFTGDETTSSYAKTGSLFLLSILNKQSAAKYASQLYKQAESALPANATINASRLFNNLTNLKQKVLAGRPISALAPSEKFVVDEVDNILGLVNNGRMNVNTTWASKRSLNEKLEKILFDTPEKKAQARARKLSSKIQYELSENLSQYSKVNPNFGTPFKSAESAFGAIAQSNAASRFIAKNLKYSPVTAGLLHLFHGPVGSLTAKAAIPYQALKLMYRIAKSPTLAIYYGNVLHAAATENAQIFNRELERLDKALKKEQSQDQYELVEK